MVTGVLHQAGHWVAGHAQVVLDADLGGALDLASSLSDKAQPLTEPRGRDHDVSNH